MESNPDQKTVQTAFETKLIKIEHLQDADALLQPAIKYLQSDEVVAFPTETVYGLGANALSSKAVDKIFKAKGRPSDNPLIVHIANMEQLKVLVSEDAFPKPGTLPFKLCEKFWPGALTILFKKSDKVPSNVTANLDRVAVRMPSHPVANKLIALSNLPLAAPSANISGRPSPTTASHVLEDLSGIIPCVIDGGNCDFGVESTVLDVFSNPPLILRPGGVTFEQLKEIIPDVQVYERKVHGTHLESKPPTPGLKYKHYSPSAKVVLFEQGSSDANMKEKILTRLFNEISQGKRVGLIHTHSSFHIDLTSDEKFSKHKESIHLYLLGDHSQPLSVAKGLFKALRDLDAKKVDVILMEGIAENEEGLAVMNRIRKASGEVVNT